MRFPRRLSAILLAVAISYSVACNHNSSKNAPSAAAMLKVAHEYGTTTPASSVVSAAAPAAQTSPETLETEAEYMKEVRTHFNEWDWDKLESEIREARATKGRLLGGPWKVYMFYQAVSAPAENDQKTTESDWTNLLTSLGQWSKAKPESSAALIATAWAYERYGGYARGGGYADTVTDQGWKLLAERAAHASELLVQAAQLKEKCPLWFEVMQEIALDQGWTRAEEKELFDQAVAFEPTYYHFYREHANFILPKWYGEEGETKRFAEEISSRVGGAQGQFLYFEIGSMLACQCDPKVNSIDGLDWVRLKQGYAALRELYGVSKLKANRFALMAYLDRDQAAARSAFEEIGPDWEPKVWSSKKNFDEAKSWALSPPSSESEPSR